MEDGGRDGAEEVPDGAVPEDAVPTRVEVVPVPPVDRTEWVVNWAGVVPVVLVLLLGVVLWRWLDGVGTSDDAGSPPVVSSSVATAPTTAPSAVTTTRPATTTAAPTTTTTTTTVVTEPRVRIRGEMGPCNFGSNCLIAGFSIEGFDEHPGRFLCIYPNSERERTFSDDDVDVACVTADEGDTITIEVDGVRSATISEEDLDGEP